MPGRVVLKARLFGRDDDSLDRAGFLVAPPRALPSLAAVAWLPLAWLALTTGCGGPAEAPPRVAGETDRSAAETRRNDPPASGKRAADGVAPANTADKPPPNKTPDSAAKIAGAEGVATQPPAERSPPRGELAPGAPDTDAAAFIDRLLARAPVALTDDDLLALARFETGLERLAAVRAGAGAISDAGLPPLAKLPALRELDLSGQSVTDAGLAALAPLQTIARLTLRDTAIGDPGLVHVAKLAALEELDLSGTRVTDAGLASLADLPRLRALRLERASISGTGLAALADKAPLDALSLRGTRPGAASFETLAKLGQLRSLDLSDTDTPNSALLVLASLGELRSLSLAGNPRVTSLGVEQLAGHKRLVTLDLTGCAGVGNQALPALQECPELERLIVTDTAITPAAADALMKKAPTLKVER